MHLHPSTRRPRTAHLPPANPRAPGRRSVWELCPQRTLPLRSGKGVSSNRSSIRQRERSRPRSPRIPRYDPATLREAVAADLAWQIDSGELPAGSKLLATMALEAIYQVSLPTIRRAVNALAEQGRLRVVRGKGTFVVR